MKAISIKHSILVCSLVLGFTALAGASPVAKTSSASDAEMGCPKCKTVQVPESERKHGILGWFQPKTKHLCPGCGSYIRQDVLSAKGIRPARVVHTCTKCGNTTNSCCGLKGGML